MWSSPDPTERGNGTARRSGAEIRAQLIEAGVLRPVPDGSPWKTILDRQAEARPTLRLEPRVLTRGGR